MATRKTMVLAAAGILGFCGLVSAETLNLPMTYYRQSTRYFCGPTTGQMITKYLTGRWVSQWSFARTMGTTSWGGTGSYGVARGIRAYSGYGYYVRYNFNRSRVVLNIRNHRPVHANFNHRYLAYRRYIWGAHHSPIKGYTSGGYYIHDTSWGPNCWASNTQMWNAVHYHHDQYSTRY